jgi:phenylacetate-CoA ligase
MRDRETLRQGHQAYALALAPRLIERIDWPADRLALHRAQRLRDLVREAVDRSPWHRERLAGIDVTRLDDDGLCELPRMTKADLMDNFDQIVTDERLSLGAVNDHLGTVTTGSYLLDRYTAVTSGGRPDTAECSSTTGRDGRRSGWAASAKRCGPGGQTLSSHRARWCPAG